MRSLSPFLLTTAFLCLAVSPAVQAQVDDARYVLTDRDAVILGPPQVFVGSSVVDIAVAPNGRYALAVEVTAPRLPFPNVSAPEEIPEVRINLWSSLREKVSTVWRSNLPGAVEEKRESSMLQSIRWIPGTYTAVVTVERGPQGRELILINAVQGSTRTISVPNGTEDGEAEAAYATELSPHPTNGSVFLFSQYNPGPEHKTVVRRLDGKTGIISEPLFHVSGGYRPSSEGFTADGRGIYLVRMVKDEKGKLYPSYVVADIETGALILQEKPPQHSYTDSLSNNGLRIRNILGQFTGNSESTPTAIRPDQSETSIRTLFLEAIGTAGKENGDAASPKSVSRVLIAADAGAPILLPDGSAVMYQSRGVLFVCPLRRQPRAKFEQARAAYENQ